MDIYLAGAYLDEQWAKDGHIFPTIWRANVQLAKGCALASYIFLFVWSNMVGEEYTGWSISASLYVSVPLG